MTADESPDDPQFVVSDAANAQPASRTFGFGRPFYRGVPDTNARPNAPTGQ